MLVANDSGVSEKKLTLTATLSDSYKHCSREVGSGNMLVVIVICIFI